MKCPNFAKHGPKGDPKRDVEMVATGVEQEIASTVVDQFSCPVCGLLFNVARPAPESAS